MCVEMIAMFRIFYVDTFYNKVFIEVTVLLYLIFYVLWCSLKVWQIKQDYKLICMNFNVSVHTIYFLLMLINERLENNIVSFSIHWYSYTHTWMLIRPVFTKLVYRHWLRHYS